MINYNCPKDKETRKMKRKCLESQLCCLQDLQETIQTLKQFYSNYYPDRKTQIEVHEETGFMEKNYYVTIWWVR